MKKELLIIIICIILIPGILGATATISQSGADSGTVMKGVSFTLTVSGLSGSGTVSINPPSGFEIPEDDKVQSFSEGTSQVSFTTISATEKMTSQTLTAQISIAGSPSTATTSSFNVVLPPSLSLTVSPSSNDVTGVNSFDLSVNIQNVGETTAQGVSASISLPSGLTTSESTEKSVGEISASSSSSIGWTINVGTPSASSNIEITVDSSNSDSESVTIPITYTGGGDNPPGGSPGGGTSGGVSTGSIYMPTEDQLKTGYTKEILKNDRVRFNVGKDTHYVIVNSVSTSSATITVNSTPQTVTLNIGEEKKFELTGDNNYDLSVKLNKITNGTKAEFTIKSISEQISQVKEITDADKEKTPASTGNAVDEGNQNTPINQSTKSWKNNNFFIIVVVVLIILIIVAAGIIFFIKKSKKNSN